MLLLTDSLRSRCARGNEKSSISNRTHPRITGGEIPSSWGVRWRSRQARRQALPTRNARVGAEGSSAPIRGCCVSEGNNSEQCHGYFRPPEVFPETRTGFSLMDDFWRIEGARLTDTLSRGLTRSGVEVLMFTW